MRKDKNLFDNHDFFLTVELNIVEPKQSIPGGQLMFLHLVFQVLWTAQPPNLEKNNKAAIHAGEKVVQPYKITWQTIGAQRRDSQTTTGQCVSYLTNRLTDYQYLCRHLDHKLDTVVMSSHEYIHYHGLLLPPLAHSMESLEYAHNFSVEDTDVFAVTYPKSGTVFALISVIAPPFENKSQ